MTHTRLAASSVAVVLLLVVGLAVGWWAASTLQSPAQVAANAAPPPPADILAEVTVGELSEQVTARSEVVRESATTVGLALGGAELNVVTAVGVAPGSELASGAAAFEVNGRPVIATTGAFPYYRDMTEGDSGPDVEQLQRFLMSRGLSTGGVGTFGPQTARAVRQLYEAAGYEALTREVAAEKPAEAGNAPGTADVGSAPDPEAGSEGGSSPAVQPVRKVVVVPRSELVVISSLPGVVSATPGVGTVLTSENAVLTVGEGAVVARAQIAVTVLPVLREGMSVSLIGTDGSAIEGTLGPVPAPPADAATPEVPVPLTTPPIEPAWLGTTVLTTITVTSVAKESLRVPSRAVALRADGTASVQRLMPDGSFQEVDVRELGRLGGTSAVEPLQSGALSAGDMVRLE